MSDEDSGSTGKIRAIRTEVYSRVVGYYRPVRDWNRGKQEEFSSREYVNVDHQAGEQGS
jgi:anaerobic ribonucleoside-triphosphate reductase